MRIGVLGTGAVGGLYGGWLAQAGHEVWFLARSDAEALKQGGLSITSPRGPCHIHPVNVVSKPSQMPECEWVLVSWKSTANKDLAKTLSAFCGANTRVINLQNGLYPEQAMLDSVSESQIFSGLCFLCAQRTAPGKIWHQDYGSITLAGFHANGPAGMSTALEQGAQMLRSGGVEVQTVADWRLARWRKLVWNIAFNGPCAIKGLHTADLLANPEYKAWVLRLMHETVSGAQSCGIPIASDFPEKMVGATLKMAPYEPSMKLDADSGRPLEIAGIYSDVLSAIQMAGGNAPAIAEVERQLKTRFDR
jgi:2-dehydropantoate 2-reductase